MQQGLALLREEAARAGCQAPAFCPRKLLNLSDRPAGEGRALFEGSPEQVAEDVRYVQQLGAEWITRDLYACSNVDHTVRMVEDFSQSGAATGRLSTERRVPMFPFDVEKFERLASNAGIDLVLATSRHNIRYLTGGYYLPTFKRLEPIGLSQYVPALGIPRRRIDQSFYVGVSVPDVDEVQALEVFGPMWVQHRHFVHELRRSVAGLIALEVARLVRALGLAGGTIGIERAFMPVETFDVLRHELPEASFVDVTQLLAELRAVKSTREIEVLREVHERTAQAIRATLATAVPREASRRIEERLEVEMASRGLHRIFTFAAIGPSYNRYPSDRTWDPGRIVNVDTVAELNGTGYLADLARMASMGEAPALALELFDHCLEVQRRVRDAIGPGVPCREIHRLGWEAIRGNRWGELGNFIAHGLGLVSNELPMFNAETEAVLEPGMVVSLEAEYRHPEVGHVKLEDSVVVTPSGCEGLGDFGREWYRVESGPSVPA